MTTAQEIGRKIGEAIARDVIADDMPRKWTGLDAQDADLVPAGIDLAEVEGHAKTAYELALAKA